MRSKGNLWLFKYLWGIAILPKEAQAVVLFFIAIVLLREKNWRLRFDAFALLIMGYASIHVISILYNLIRAAYDTTRIIAAFNTACIWYIAAFFYMYYKDNDNDINTVSRYCFINSTLMIIFVLAARYLRRYWGEWHLPILGNTLYHYESPYSRFLGFMEYPTLVAAFTLLMVPWAVYFIINNTPRPARIPLISVYYVLAFIPVFYCYSRAGYILLLAGAAGMFYLHWKARLTQKSRFILIIAIVITVLIGAVPLYGYAISGITHLLSMREGSNSTRLQIYSESLDNFQKNWLVGCGIKKIGKMGYPLGSHSSYIGFLYKTGIIGSLLVISAFLNQAIFLIRKFLNTRIFKEAVCMLFALLIYGYCIFEDIDGVDWLVCTWFAVIGLIRSGKQGKCNDKYINDMYCQL